MLTFGIVVALVTRERSMLTTRSARGFLRLALLAGVLAVLSYTRADPDLWGHVRFGQDMIAAGTVQLADQYSFASDRPWVNHEWLAESIMSLAYAAGGGFGLIALKVALLLAMLGGVAYTLRSAHVPAATRDLLIGLVLVCTIPQANHVRPQLFSLALFAWLLAVLVLSRRRPWAAILTVPILAIWANLHGGWIVGAGTLAVWAAAGLMTAAPARDKLTSIVIAMAAVAATAANPYGWHLWEFLRETVGLSRADVTDWQPILSLGTAYVFLWGLIAVATITAIARAAGKRSLDVQAVTVVLMFGAATFQVSRLQAFFAISFVALMGAHLVRRASASAKQEGATRSHDGGSDRRSRFAAGVAAALGLVILAASLTSAAKNAGCIRLEPAMFPDAGVISVAEQRGLHGRMLTWFDWGEYAIWHWGPRVAVSMDGRRETAYSDAAIQRHLTFYFKPDERQAILDTLRPDYIWLPSRLEVVNRLKSDGWHPVFAGHQSVLLAKADDALGEADVRETPAPRCFPGP